MTNKRCFRQTLMAESRQKRLTRFFNSQIIFQQRWTLTVENLHKEGENESNNQMYCVKQSQQSETRITTKRSPHSVQKVWAQTHTTSIDFLIRPSPPLFFFPTPPHFWEHFFDNIVPSEIRNKHKNKRMRESCFFMFRRLQHNNICFFYKKHVYILRSWDLISNNYNTRYQKELKEI